VIATFLAAADNGSVYTSRFTGGRNASNTCSPASALRRRTQRPHGQPRQDQPRPRRPLHHLGVGAAHKSSAVTILIDADTATVIHQDTGDRASLRVRKRGIDGRLQPQAIVVSSEPILGNVVPGVVGHHVTSK
jgi:hypothetical protein